MIRWSSDEISVPALAVSDSSHALCNPLHFVSPFFIATVFNSFPTSEATDYSRIHLLALTHPLSGLNNTIYLGCKSMATI